MAPKITVITVTLNSARTLERTIKSVIRQDYENLEYIVIDGGSDDGTLDIIKKYGAHISKWVSEPDDGLYYAMNKGLEFATGDYVNFLNSDDWFEREALKKIAWYIDRMPADVVYGDFMHVKDGKREFRSPKPLSYMYWLIPMNSQATFIKNTRDWSFDTSYKSAADYKLVYEMYMAGKSFLYVPSCIANFSLDGFSSDMYRTACEVLRITCEGLVKQKDKAGLYFPFISEMFLRRENYHRFLTGENHERIVEFINSLVTAQNEVVLFGTGDILSRYIGILSKTDLHIKYLVDNDSKKWENKIYGYEIKSPETLLREKDTLVCIMSDRYHVEISEQLEEMGLDESLTIYNYPELKRCFIYEDRNSLMQAATRITAAYGELLETVGLFTGSMH